MYSVQYDIATKSALHPVVAAYRYLTNLTNQVVSEILERKGGEKTASRASPCILVAGFTESPLLHFPPLRHLALQPRIPAAFALQSLYAWRCHTGDTPLSNLTAA